MAQTKQTKNMKLVKASQCEDDASDTGPDDASECENPMWAPSDQELDGMNDTRYQAFVDECLAWHRKYDSGSCICVRRRKTREERAKDEEELRKFYAEHNM